MAAFRLPGMVFGFRRDRSGAQLVKCTRDDGAPTLLMKPRPGGPPLYEKDIEVHVSATKEYGLAVTVARSDGGFEHTLGDILGDACDNVDFAKKRSWTWWSGGVVRPEAKAPTVKPRGPGKSAAPVVIRKPAPAPRPERSSQTDQTVAVPEVTTQPSSSAPDFPSTPELPQEPVPPAAPAAATEVDAAKVAGMLTRRLVPLFVGGFAVVVTVVWAFLHFQHADLLALMSKQQQPRSNPTMVTEAGEIAGAIGQRRLPLFDGQDRPPCYGVSQEKDGGCWVEIAAKPPCPETTFEKDGKCWVPASGFKKREPRSGEAR